MNCPSCHGAMEPLSFQSHLGTPLEIDACWGCQLIWFDSMESTALAPQSVVDLFKRIHAARDVSRNVVAMKPACPRCNDPLGLTRDMTARGGSFSYHRCLNGHGRLISFTQFLREKNFIRSLNSAEVQRLAVTIKQIRCSSCGASVNLETDSACTHCGSAISVLDEQAVQKALDDYASRSGLRPLTHGTIPKPPIRWPTSPSSSPSSPSSYTGGGWAPGDMLDAANTGGLLVDLVYEGISALFD